MSQQIKLAEATDFVLDGTHGSPKRCDRGIPVLSAQNVKGGKLDWSTDRFTDESEYIAFNRRVPLRKGDVLLTIVGTVGRAAVLEEVHPLVFQRSVAVIRPDTQVLDSRFLFHAFQSSNFQRQLARSTNQSSQAGVYLGKIKELRIPLPPLEEQRRIAGILDQAEELRAKRRAAIALLDQLPQAIFLEMFGDPIVNPMGLPMVNLSEICDLQNGYAFRSTDYVEQSGTLNCRMSNIRPDGTFDPDYSPKFLPDSFANKYKSFLLNDGDVLIAMTDMASEARILGVPTVVRTNGKAMLLNQRVGKLIIDKEKASVAYLRQALSDKSVKNYYMRFAGGGVQINLGKADLLSASILLPPIELQREFAARVEAIYRAKVAQKSALSKIDALFSSLQAEALPRGN